MSLSTTSKRFLNTSRDGDSTTSLGSLSQCLTTLSVKKVFPDIQPKLTLVQLQAISPHPVTCHQWEEINPALAVSTFQILEESKKVSPQPSFPQTKQPQYSVVLLSNTSYHWTFWCISADKIIGTAEARWNIGGFIPLLHLTLSVLQTSTCPILLYLLQ